MRSHSRQLTPPNRLSVELGTIEYMMNIDNNIDDNTKKAFVSTPLKGALHSFYKTSKVVNICI